MRPPPPTLLPPLLLLLSGFGAAAPPSDSLAQLPAPGNLKVHLYNTQQALTWEPVSLDSNPRPVVYQVQYKYSTSSNWYDVNKEDSKVDCTNLTRTECDFTANSLSEGFPRHFNISLRVRAKLGGLVSAWATAPWFEHYRNATIGPPENIRVTPEEGSLIIRLSAPFDVPASEAYFVYYVYYWEKAGDKQVTDPFESNFITLNDLKPLRVYCFQVQAKLILTKENISRPGHLSNISCSKTAADASVKLQQDILAAATTFLVLSVVVGSCLFLVLKYRGLVKHWFHSPPSIPSQIEEYLKDPAQPILDALDKDSSPKEDTWDSVSVVMFPENEQEGTPQSAWNQNAGCTIFENCKTCRNGSWGGTLDDFYVKGIYCAECRAGWYGGDCMRCGQVLHVPKGQILLESYPLNAHCEWTIHAKPGFIIQLRIVMLSLEFDYMCQYDYVEVRDGDSSDSQIIKRFCGNERPAPIRSTGSSLHILFHSDGSKNFDGFHAIFEEITACSSSPCFHDGTCLLDSTRSYKCACLAGYTGKHCENLLEERNCSDPGGPVNGYKKITGGPGLIHGRYAKIGTVLTFFCNSSYVLSGNEMRTCQQNGEWSGKQPICIKACREPKISDLVRRKVLPMQVQSRETPLHQLYSSAFSKQKLQDAPTKKPVLPFGALPPGYQHLHAQLQYECISPFYRRLGSSRRTCLKTGKWSGRAPSCIPICGKTENVSAPKTQGTRWPWQAAIYRRAGGVHGGGLHKDAWFLVCSGALVNERTVVVAAHCVTDLGRVTVIKTADLKVVLGKFYRDDDREEKSIQNLRISAIILHPNYDPILLDTDIAILKLLDKARISTRVQPICLAAPRDLSTSFQESSITVAGWNILADASSPGYKDDTLRSGVVRVADSLLCEEQHEAQGIPVSVTDSMFCASRDPAAPSDICTAETGGIAAVSFPGRASPEPRWHLVGLVSWSYDKTCSHSLSTAFTKVLPFKDWIERNMK